MIEKIKPVSREDLITSVPLIRVRDGIGVDVPLAIVDVPVRVHRPEKLCGEPPSPPSLDTANRRSLGIEFNA